MLEGKDELNIIQDDIKRALSKPNPKWAMVIDTRRCVLCHACTVGCIAEHKLPPGVKYRPVYEQEEGRFPNVRRMFTPRPCQQCDNPPCVEACPKKGKATWKSKKGINNEIVMISYNECIGCGRCIPACPYGARTLDEGGFYTEGTPKVKEYELSPNWEYSHKWSRKNDGLPIGKARKCHFCYHRLKNGMVPMCVSTCIARANYFGDMDDAQSLIYKVMKENKLTTLKEIKEMVVTGISTKLKDKKPIKSSEWRVATSKAIERYPGKTPVFGSSWTKPSVFYIL